MVRPGAWRALASRQAASGTADAAPVRTTSPSLSSREMAMLSSSRTVSVIPGLRSATEQFCIHFSIQNIAGSVHGQTKPDGASAASGPRARGVGGRPAKAVALVPADPVRVAQLDEAVKIEPAQRPDDLPVLAVNPCGGVGNVPPPVPVALGQLPKAGDLAPELLHR